MNIGGICIDKAAHRVTIDGKEIELSFKEFELLTYFAENQGIALSREKILNNVWNYDYFGDARTIDTHVKKLRSKMGEKGDYTQAAQHAGAEHLTGHRGQQVLGLVVHQTAQQRAEHAAREGHQTAQAQQVPQQGGHKGYAYTPPRAPSSTAHSTLTMC